MVVKKARKAKTPAPCPPPERRVVLLVVGAPHGVRGECRVKTFTADPLAIADYGPLFAADGRVFTVEQCRPLKDDLLVLRFAGIADRDRAAALTGTELFVDRAALPEPGEEEYYHSDLIGLAVVDSAGTTLGRIGAIHDFGAGDILEIRPEAGGATWLLPFTRAAAPQVEIAAGRVVIDPAFLMKPEPAGDAGREDRSDPAP